MTSRMRAREYWGGSGAIMSFGACSDHSRDDESSEEERGNVIVFRQDHGVKTRRFHESSVKMWHS